MKPGRIWWKKDERATGLRKVTAGPRGYTLLRDDEALGCLQMPDWGAPWEAWVYRSDGPNVRLKARFEGTSDGLATAKATLLAAVRKHGKLAAEDT